MNPELVEKRNFVYVGDVWRHR